MPLSHQQVSPWPFKALACGTKKAERCCFKPLQALQILSCCFLTGPTQPGTVCLTLWLLMSKSTCSLRVSSLLPFPFLRSLSMSSLLPPTASKNERQGCHPQFFFLLNTHCSNASDPFLHLNPLSIFTFSSKDMFLKV